jgi:diguanylate cyclase (GGDEF)-like protein/PAS domain S-box-containing protein
MSHRPPTQTHSRLRSRLKQAEETLHAIQSGQVDAIMVATEQGSQILAIEGMDSAYRTLVESMSEGIVTLNPEGMILYSNRGFARILDVALIQVTSSFFQSWVALADLPEFAGLMATAKNTGNSQGELTLSFFGTLIPVQLSINALRLGTQEAYSCMVTNLTEQTLAQLVLDQATEAIIVCDDHGRIIRASQSADTLYGGDLTGQQFAAAFPLYLAGGDRLEIGPTCRGERLQCEAMLERNDCQLYFLVNAGPLASQQKNLLGCIITMTDISARKQAQQALMDSVDRYRSLVLATTQVVWAADAKGGVTGNNPSWCAYTDQSETEMQGHGWAKALHPDDFHIALQHWLEALAGGTTYATQVRLRRFDGTYRYHIMRGVPVLTQEGAIREWIGTAIDIHEQQLAETRLILEHGVARLLAESETLPDTMLKIIRLICDTFDWDCAIRWVVNGQTLQVAETWRSLLLKIQPPPESKDAPKNGKKSSAQRVKPAAISTATALAREVVRQGEPVTLADIRRTSDSTAASKAAPKAAKRRPHAAFAFPVLIDAQVVGVLGFFSRETIEPDPLLLQTVTTLGRQIGLFLQRKKTEGILRLRERALEASTEAVFIARCAPDSADGALIEYVNPAFEKITGYPAAQVIGMDLLKLEQQLSQDLKLDEIHDALRDKRAGHAITHNTRQDGSHFWSDLHIAPVRGERGDHGRTTHFVGIQNDVSQSMRYQSALEHQANHDALTGLPNRNLLNDRLQRAISSAQRNDRLMALVFVDLDHFKLINDTLGHDAGDIVLKAIAARLTACLRDADTAARPGGDEFLLILVDQDSTDSISIVIRRILDMIAQPIPLDGRDLYVTCSIGISIYLQDGDDVSTLLKNADTAMYHAKERGRNNFQFFNNAMNQKVHERFMLESSLRQAITNGELTLMYQPQIDLKSDKMIGMEALLRWRHPEWGIIAPTKFIPIAEESGLIITIGEWVLRTACARNKAWQDAGLAPMIMAVNLSARQFKQNNLAQTVANVLAETGLDAQYLELELTESLVLDDSHKFMQTLTQLKALGLQLTIDDFGTGYSSLSYLKNLPLDRLKIDIRFVNDIVTDTGDAAIAQTIITLGHSLGMKVIAEGVETQEQLAFLRNQGCDEIQGFFFSHPLSHHALEALLRGPSYANGWHLRN